MKFTNLLSKACIITVTAFTLQCGLVKPGQSQEEPTFLWAIESPQNTVYLLGSVHTLRETDYPLPQPMQDAFDDAEHLIFETNLADLDSPSAQEAILQSALPDSPDENFQCALTPEAYDLAESAASEVGLPIEVFNSFEPWFFTMTLTSLKLVQLGFEPNFGVDFHLFNAAQESGKTISALETLEEQLSFFDTLSIQTQTELVEQTVLELALLESSFNQLIDAWKLGDIDTFEQLILESFVIYPEIYEALLTQRNQNWLTNVEPLINQPDDYLVVVGAAHLVGDDSLIRLLQAQGFTVQQIGQDSI